MEGAKLIPGGRCHGRNLKRLVRLGFILGFLAAAGLPLVSMAELIYDNSRNDLGTFLSQPGEFGDEVDFAGTARTITEIEFVMVAERDLPSGARAVIRIYANDGPPLPTRPPVPSPGTLLYQSNEIAVEAGVWPIRIVDIAVPVPNRITWTIEFLGAGSQIGERAGLQVYHPPVVGRSFRDYWVRSAAGAFNLFLLDSGQPASFAARFEAIPDPPITLKALPQADGTVDLQASGPIGSDLLVETSVDLRQWRPFSFLSLATNATARLDGLSLIAFHNRYYRIRLSPYPGQTALLTRIQTLPTGQAEITLVGSVNSEHVLEFSTDHQSWRTLEILRIGSGPVTFVDPMASSVAPRFYRTRRPADARHLYRIRTVQRAADGSATLICTTPTGIGNVAVEASINLKDWVELGRVLFNSPEMEFVDAQAGQFPHRFYRLRDP